LGVGSGAETGALLTVCYSFFGNMQLFGNSEMVPDMLSAKIALGVLMGVFVVHLIPNGVSHCFPVIVCCICLGVSQSSRRRNYSNTPTQ
jgi:hypothetical protein